MKTRDEAEAYLGSITRWKDKLGDVADPGPRHTDFYKYKESIDLDDREFSFVDTNSDLALKGEPRFEEEDIQWQLKIKDLGRVHLHLNCFDDPDVTGTWAELWLESEPWWNGDDPYECTQRQIAAIVRALPEEHLQKYVELASRKAGFVDDLAAAGILPAADSASRPR